MHPRIVIDPGHGGLMRAGASSPLGARGPRGLLEKDVTLAVGQRLAARFGPAARLTRSADVNLTLAERASLARACDAPVFLSLHANAGAPGERGAEVWVHDEASPRCCGLADDVAGALARWGSPARRGGRGALALLSPRVHAASTARCLVELDYLTDDGGERRLGDPRHLDAIADALHDATAAHLGASRGFVQVPAYGYVRELSRDLAPSCPWWLPAEASADYTRYAQPATRGRVSLLINGRNSGGAGPDRDLTEPLDEMQRAVVATAAGDVVYLSAWFFEPATPLTQGPYAGETTWGGLFAKKAQEGVKIRILINDFDPIAAGLVRWLEDDCLTPLDAIIGGLPPAARDNLKYVVSLHPAHVGGLKSWLAGQGWRDIHVASHHQKFMIVRRGGRLTAFCGGLDIESRKTPARWSYARMIGWHDIHVKLEGPITRDLEKEFVQRWNRERSSSRRAARPGWAAFEALAGTALTAAENDAAHRVHEVQMLRTVSVDGGATATYDTTRDDVLQGYHHAIDCATQFLYLENQYFRSTQLADRIVARGRAQPGLIVILVVVASAAADDDDNAITRHGDHLQYETFRRIVDGLGASRVRIYTMFHRAVHSKLLIADDRTIDVGSANANVRSFELDSELNVQLHDRALVAPFRKRLWAHNLGVAEATVGGWAVSDFLARWDAVASANRGRAGDAMAGEGILAFDHTANQGESHDSIPDALADLDFAPDGRLYAGTVPADGPFVPGGDRALA